MVINIFGSKTCAAMSDYLVSWSPYKIGFLFSAPLIPWEICLDGYLPFVNFFLLVTLSSTSMFLPPFLCSPCSHFTISRWMETQQVRNESRERGRERLDSRGTYSEAGLR